MFQNLKMVNKFLKKTKLSLPETSSSNDIFDKVIEMEHAVSEIIDIVVESSVWQNGIVKKNVANVLKLL